MCLFSLALVDLIYLTAIFMFYVERIYTQFTDYERYGPVYQYMVYNHVIVLFGFGYVHLFLVALVATERCICVLFPLRGQRCMPTKTLAFFIVVSALILVCLRFAVILHYQVTCFYDMRSQRISWEALRQQVLFPEPRHDPRCEWCVLRVLSRSWLSCHCANSHHYHCCQTHSDCSLAQPDVLQFVQ